MKSCAVFIATTGGPVQVLQLTPERAPQSMVCVNRTTNVLPVPNGYDQRREVIFYTLRENRSPFFFPVVTALGLLVVLLVWRGVGALRKRRHTT